MSMNILVIGSGGREHALVWALARSPRGGRILCAPGNPGIGQIGQCVPLRATDLNGLAEFAVRERIDLTVVGPETPLAEGIVDLFHARGLAIFGPTRRAAELEWSKAFAKDFMARHGVPTARHATFTAAQQRDAEEYVRTCPLPFVLKADGLAGGKGVVICEEPGEAVQALRSMFDGTSFGAAGRSVVIEEYLEGDEASVFAVTDGRRYVTLAPAQDHKRALDDDQGMNTGGMGAYAPTPFVPPDVLAAVERDIIQPVLKGMEQEARRYRGCLYAGLMITPAGPRVIEFNCRFGDPETQVVLPLYGGDLARLLFESAQGELSSETLAQPRQEGPGAAACVVLAAAGYPGPCRTGLPIRGLDTASSRTGILVFHAGTASRDGQVVTAGGRVLGVTAVSGSGLAEALSAAYQAIPDISFEGMQYRHDIGKKAFRQRMQQGQSTSREPS